jgi:CDP-diacylglycerol--glycerol-3-phosphate 3-phosphatidyltransferase/cardiolipin synthase
LTPGASGQPEDGSCNSERWGTVVVSVIIGIRFLAAPLFLVTFTNDLWTWALGILLVAVLSDAVDGLAGRRFGGASPLLGAYSDPVADFTLVLAAFTAFVLKDIYPGWLLLLIIAMFAQFVLTSRLTGPIYDPVGKYYGVFLFGAAGLTVVVRSAGVRQALLVLILAFTVASVSSRALLLLGFPGRRTPGRHGLDVSQDHGVEQPEIGPQAA